MTSAFTFHGEHPEDWHDDYMFLYEALFRAALTDEQLVRLAETWHAHFKEGPASRGHWTFSGRFGSFSVHPTGTSNHRAAMNQVRSFLDQVNTFAPISDVVFYGATEDLSYLDAGPAFPSTVRSIDPELPQPASNDLFEERLEALDEEAKQEARRELDQKLTKRKAKEIGLARCELVDAPLQSEYPERMNRHFAGPESGHFDGSFYAPRRVFTEGFKDGARVRLEGLTLKDGLAPFPHGETYPPLYGALHPTGERMLLALGRTLYELDLQSRRYTELWGDLYEIEGSAWLDDTHVALLAGDHNQCLLRVIELGEKTHEIERVELGRHYSPELVCVAQGKVVVVMLERSLRLSAWVGEQLKPCGVWKVPELAFHKETLDGRVFLRRGGEKVYWYTVPEEADVSSSELFELTQISEVLDKLTPKSKPTKKATAKKARPRPEFEEIAADSVPAENDVLDDREIAADRAKLERQGYEVTHSYSPVEGNIVNLTRRGSLVVAGVAQGFAFIDDADEEATVCALPKDPPIYLSRPQLTADGRLAFASDRCVLYEASREREHADVVLNYMGMQQGLLVGLHIIGPDDLLMLFEKGLCRYARKDGRWQQGAITKISKAKRLLGVPEKEIAVVATESKHTIQVFSYAPAKPKKLAQLIWQVIDLGSQLRMRAVDGEVYLIWRGGTDRAHQIVNL